MRFAFTDQQIEFRDAVRSLLSDTCTTADVRAAHLSPSARGPRWAALAELGVCGLLVPEAQGGLGLGLVDLVPLVEAAGRVALPEPLAITAGVAAPLLADVAADARGMGTDRARPWLEAIAAGTATVAVATATPAGTPVVGADGADLIVTVGGTGDGPHIHVVDGGSGICTPVPSLDPTRRLALVGGTPTPDSRVATGSQASVLLHTTAARAAVVTAAELLGLADAMIAMAATYATERNQFGRPIGSFQAVKHLLADAQVRLEFARPTVYAAAWAIDRDAAAATRSVAVAKAYASEAALEAARVSLQVHGAIGYTWECDLQLFLKRAWALAEDWGSADEHRARLLESLLADR